MSDLNIPLCITERREESRDCLSLVFKRPEAVRYAPGDWMDIRFPAAEFPVGRTYSPTEPNLRITFRKGVRPFKQRLERGTPGETMLISQYDSNGFRLDPRYPADFVAGGVGLTAFRSMIKELVDTDTSVAIDLVYQNRSDDFPFRQELDAWASACPWLSVHLCRDGTPRSPDQTPVAYSVARHRLASADGLRRRATRYGG